MLPKPSAYVKSYDEQTKLMYLLIEDDHFLEKCNTIWDVVSAVIKKEFNNKPIYNKIPLKTKIKSHARQIIDDLESSSDNSDDSDKE